MNATANREQIKTTDAYNSGFAARQNDDINCPYLAQTIEADYWDMGWNDADDERNAD